MIRPRSRLILAALLLPIRHVVAQQPLVVPRGPAPTLDGTVDTVEWRGSLVRSVRGGGQVFFRRDDRYLYVGVRSRKPGFAAVCIEHGDTVSLLQAASALGEARFAGTGARRRQVQEFDWQLRGGADTADARAAEARERFLRQGGWLGTTRAMGATDKEFQIALDRLPPRVVPIQVVYQPDEGKAWSWPMPSPDGCGNPFLMAGINISPVRFRLGAWPRLKVGSR